MLRVVFVVKNACVFHELPCLILCFSFSRMKDRNFDMPYIMLRGQNFFVTYGWSLNNVCQVLVEHNFVSIHTNQ